MNKRSFKTIFNARRGALMAVAETAASQGKSASGESSSAFSLGAAFGLALLSAMPAIFPLTAISQIIADPNAPRSQQAIILPAANGVPIVNIVTPTAGGVSMNQFSQFNVNSNGAILNNGRLNTQTQLGGWIQANPNLATGSASLIVNQVNSNNPTLLNGYIEVAGQRAQVIIANPSGIQVNGAGFINAQSATLTTGLPNFNGNVITGYTVNQGTVQINGAGLDASTTDYTAILARAVQINAGIWAKQLDVVTGANQINVSSAAATPTGINAATPTGAVPLFAIDVSSLGGMYAGKIMLIGTEAGLGFKNTGTIMGVNSSLFAGAGDVRITVDGILTNGGRIQSAGAMTATLGTTTTGGIVNTGTIYAGASSTITTNGDVTNSGQIAAQGNLALTANGANSNIVSSSTSLLAAGISSAGVLGTPDTSTGNLQISATQSISANGQNLAAQNLTLSAQTINLSGSNTYAGNSMNIAVSTGSLVLDNTNIGAGNIMALSTPTLLSTRNSNVSAGQLNVNAHDWDNTAGNVSHTGTGDFTLNLAGNLTNAQGKIKTNAAHTNITAANLNNTDGVVAGQGAANIVTSTAATQSLTNTNGTIFAGQDLTVSASAIGNDKGLIQGLGNVSIDTHHASLINTNAGAAGGILSGGNLSIASGALDSSAGFIAANGNLSITALDAANNRAAITNTGGIINTAQNLSVSGASLANNQGQIQSQQSAALDFAGGAVTSQQGLIRASKTLALTAVSVDNSNTQGTNQGIEAANISISAATVNNNQGAVRADMGAGLAANLTIASSALVNNNQGVLSSSGRLNITDTGTALAITSVNGSMVANGDGTIKAASLDNSGGSLVAQNLTLTTQALASQTLTNTNGTIYGRGDVVISSGGLGNDKGLIQASGNASINTNGGLLTNTNSGTTGGIVASKNLTITSGSLDNTAGYIAAGGNITVTAASLTNTNAQIQALGDVTLAISGAVTNQQGLLRSAGNLTVTSASLDNSNTMGANQGVEGSNISITAGTISNNGGAMRADMGRGTNASLTITSGGTLDNTNGLVSSTGNLTVNDSAATSASNNPAKTLAITNTNGSLVAGKNLVIDAATLTGDGKSHSTGDLTLKLIGDHSNSQTGEIVANGNASISVTGLLTNRGLIDSAGTNITSGGLSNLGTGRIYGDTITINTGELLNADETVAGVNTAPVIAARSSMDVTATNINNLEHALLFSAGDMNLTASGTIRNASATIESLGNMSLVASNIVNSNEHFSVVQLPYGSATSFTQYQGDGSANRYDSANMTVNNCPGPPCYDAIATGEHIEDYTIFQFTRTQTKTNVATTDPAKILVGGNLQLNGGDITNNLSLITVGGNLIANGRNINNLQASGNITTTDNGTAEHTHNEYNGKASGTTRRDYDGQNPYTNVAIQSITLPVATYVLNTAPAGTGTTVAAVSNNLTAAATGSANTSKAAPTNTANSTSSATTVSRANPNVLVASVKPNITVPNNALFRAPTNPSANYLVETDPQFANYRLWIGSDYLLAQLNLDPTTTQKRLGDGFYEQRLIREQVSQLTGKRFLDGYQNDEEEYIALMNAGATFARAHQLTVGVRLTDDQIALLTTDIVWLVETEVTLAELNPDGSAKKVKALVPQVYARLQKGDLQDNGLLLSANNIVLNMSGSVNNMGSMGARGIVAAFGTNINNSLAGRISGRDVTLVASNDINNIGGTVSATNSMNLSAGGNITIASTTSSSTSTTTSAGGAGSGFGGSFFGGASAGSSSTNTRMGRVAGLYLANPNGTIAMSANNTISLIGATVNSSGNVQMTASNIYLGTLVTGSNQHVALGGGNYLNQSSQIDNGSTVGAGGNITMVASNRIVGVAANITGGRNVTLFGVNGVDLLAGQNTSYVDTNITSGSKSLTSSQTNTQSTSAISTALGTSVTGGNVSITSSMGSITLQAANITAQNALNLSAVNGTIAFTSANQSSFNSVASTGSSTLTQSASGNGQSSTNASFTQLHYGNLSVAAQSITIDVSGNQSITSLASQPGMGWITQLRDDPALAGKIDWNKIDEAHKNWNYSQQGLSPAGAALLSIALAYATGGGANINFLGGGAIGNAGFLSLATQASLAFANNGGDLGKALESLGSSANVRGLLTSMLTAGVIQALPNLLPTGWMTAGATGASKFGELLTNNLLNAAATAVVSSAVNGTSLEEALKKGFLNAIVATGSAQVNFLIGSNTLPNSFANYLAHAIAGCVAGAAQASSSGGCSAGAIGGVIGEAAAEMYNSNNTGATVLPDTTQFAGLMAAMAMAAIGGDPAQIVIAQIEGSSAALNNQSQAFAARSAAQRQLAAQLGIGLEELLAKIRESGADTVAFLSELSQKGCAAMPLCTIWVTAAMIVNGAAPAANNTSGNASTAAAAMPPNCLPGDDECENLTETNNGEAARKLGEEREQKAAEQSGGRVSNEKVTNKYGHTDIDVVGPNGELIGVGGKGKGNNLGNLGRELRILQEEAEKRGVSVQYYLAPDTPQNVVNFIRQRIGTGNVFFLR